MANSKAYLLAPLIILAACGTRKSSTYDRAEVYAVYAAAIDSFGDIPSHPIPIESTTRANSLAQTFGDTSVFYRGVQSDTGVSEDLFGSYERANANRDSLCDCFPMPVDLRPGISAPGSNGPLVLSAVGFDRQRARALVWVGRSCGPLCGSSALFLMVKGPRGWTASRRLLGGAS